MQELPANALIFCFVDPFNWEISFSSIERLTKDRRIDLAITFHSGSMKRVADNPPKELDDFFGGSWWQEEYRKSLATGRREGTRVLLNMYEAKLENLGYPKEGIQDYVLVKRRALLLYHILFASKSSRGKDFWNKISQRTSSGQRRMFWDGVE